MKPRLNAYKAAPDVMRAMMALESQIQSSRLDPSLVEVVKTRASQINGCAFCIHMHSHDAREKGESAERLYLLDAWRASALDTDRERAALAWTEAVTLASATHVPDIALDAARAHFSEEELAELTLLIATMNAWNRFAIGFRSVHPLRSAAAA